MSTALTPASNIDWKNVLENVTASAKIPGISSSSIKQSQTVIRDLYVDLGDVKAQITKAGVNPLSTIIYADVIHIPARTIWNLSSSGLVLVARRIEVEDEAQVFLDCRKTQTATFIVYAKEWQGSLQTVVVSSANPKEQPAVFTLDSMDSVGIQIACPNGQPVSKRLDTLQAPMLEEDSDLQLSLVSNFQCAIILSDTHRAWAYDILGWIRVCAAQSQAFVHLLLQSTSMMVTLSSANTDMEYVPVLSRNVYTDMAQAFVPAAQRYETQYDRFFDKNQNIEERIKAAKLMLENYRDKTGYDAEVIKQSEGNLRDAKRAVEAASGNLRWQQVVVQNAQITFEAGLKQWEYDKKLEASFKIIGGILTFAAASAELCFGDPEGVTAAGKAVAVIAKESAQMAALLKQLARLLGTLSKTYDIAEKLSQIAGSIKQPGSLVKRINSMDLASTDDEQTMTSDYWSKFKLQVDSQLTEAVSQHVGGAREYKLALDTLVVYGQSLVTNQLAYVRCSQELVRLQLQHQLTVNQAARIQQYIEELSQSQQPNEKMEQMLYQRYLDMKISLFIALRNYVSAYRYWALRKPITSPAITGNVASLNNYLSDIEQDYASALESFDPPPQTFLDKQYVISEQSVLQSLRQKASCKWTIPLDVGIFQGFDRVRLAIVRVWLDGVKSQKNTPVYIMIGSSGSYQDRLADESYQFSSTPLLRGFQYDVTSKEIFVDGQVADEEKYAYFQPTPFTDWTITLPEDSNKGIDLSGVTQIRMEFHGSLIADKHEGRKRS